MTSSISVDPSVVARTQHGVISAEQARQHGFSVAEVSQLCRAGRWTRLRRGLYLPGPDPGEGPERTAALVAAALWAFDRKDAAAAHISAAQLWDARWLTSPDPGVVWIGCDVPGKPRYYPGLKILPAALPPDDVVDLAGLPVSTPARTCVDLARHLSFEQAVVAIDSLRLRQNVSRQELEAVLERCRGWPFVQRARRAIAFSTVLSESPLESQARIAFDRAGLHPPQLQVEVRDARGRLRRVDFLFGRRTVAEADGRMKYDDPAVLWDEKQREDDLREVGYGFLRITHRDVVGSPAELRRRVIAAMARVGDA